nr:MAG TPA: hypothetical protein [Caudoviricetes sp.]DAZ78901.1 MAG TPA: hypothetical protein [Caudoviricetes sp.]
MNFLCSHISLDYIFNKKRPLGLNYCLAFPLT